MKYKRGDINFLMAITLIFGLYLFAFLVLDVTVLHISFASMMALALIGINVKQKNKKDKLLKELKTKNDYLINKLKRRN